jgi:predicted O-linked N-acetylglucosamine transferase (SPINDLY family)
MRRWELALADLDQAVRLKADFAEAYHNRGIALAALKQFDAALASYDQAIALKPEQPASHFARGIALNCLNRSPEALASLERALQLAPDFAEGYIERGTTLKRLGRQDLAVASYERASALKPDHDWLQGLCVHERLYLCDWSNLSAEIASLSVKVERGAKAVTPFHLLTLIDSPLLQRRAAQTYAEHKCPSQLAPPLIRRRPQGERIRIGYFSADFFNHATAYLMAQVFERHDRARFHVVGFSFGPEVRDEMSKRLSSAFDELANVHTRSDRDVAELSRERQIDIAVDLKGFTSHSRPEIFAHRAAPIQVSYQGYPGTAGASYIDYIVADRTVIPEQSREHFTERVAYLPDSYFANGVDLAFRQTMHSRSELGLPSSGFVFCCFNNAYKIMPVTFDSWMRVLRQVPGSVLWLLQDGEDAARTLRNEARSRGVDEKRLIFAARTTVSEHLPRHRVADLFLDTLPCNAHTTAFDALSMGLPVLTRAGHSFASRVAASLLNAVGLPELITHDEEHYESLAVALANDPERLAGIRAELQNRRLTAPLFKPQLLTQRLEQAYTLMYQRYRQNLPPQDLEIPA